MIGFVKGKRSCPTATRKMGAFVLRARLAKQLFNLTLSCTKGDRPAFRAGQHNVWPPAPRGPDQSSTGQSHIVRAGVEQQLHRFEGTGQLCLDG
jgi:hypothetical protein